MKWGVQKLESVVLGIGSVSVRILNFSMMSEALQRHIKDNYNHLGKFGSAECRAWRGRPLMARNMPRVLSTWFEITG